MDDLKVRPRRLRQTQILRKAFRETMLSTKDLVLPLFVRFGKKVRKPISSMPGQFQLSVDYAVQEARQAESLGIPAVILFGIPDRKNAIGSQASMNNGIIQRALNEIKSRVPGILLIADCCLCEYTSHGHCGVVKKKPHGRWTVDNDATLKILAQTALSQAGAGADMIAPSGMMDGMVKSIRSALDKNGFEEKIIMAYSVKYASNFYGPFRQAAEGSPKFGDRKDYQMDFSNSDEALKEVRLDLEEGADIVMVKPALSYLDIIWRVKNEFHLPVAAYNVSGEYSMVKAAAKYQWLDETKITLEILKSIKRAGADLIITYHAKEAAKWIRNA